MQLLICSVVLFLDKLVYMANQQVAVYKIEEEYKLLQVTQIILEEKYKTQELKKSISKDFNLSLFYKEFEYTPKWKKFISPIVLEGEKILTLSAAKQENYILLLENKKSKNIFAITGGYGYGVISGCACSDFGINVLSRFITKEDKIIKSTREKSLVGGILGTTKYFRNSFNLDQNSGFGKIYLELQAAVEKKLLIDLFGFSEDDVKKNAVCSAKSSFRINKSISFRKLLEIIKICEDILNKKQVIAINDVKKLSSKRNSLLIEKLKEKLLEQLWLTFQKPDEGYPFDLCHTNFEEYLTAYYYKIKINKPHKSIQAQIKYFDNYEFDSLNNVEDVFALIKEKGKIKNLEQFSRLLQSMIIVSHNEEGVVATRSDFFAHLMGDVSYENKKYFYVDKVWYQIEAAFIKDLNSSCKNFIEKNNYPSDLNLWNKSLSEDEYNALYIGEQYTLVLHKILSENIELCDILKWDRDNIYLIHVKKGFSNTMRDLCAQITIAANRLMRDLMSDSSRDFLKSLYEDLKSKKEKEGYYGQVGQQVDSISAEQFVQLFDSRKVNFVLAVLDTAESKKRDLKDMEEFESSIAKFSLHTLTKDMAVIGPNLYISPIKAQN